MSRRNRREPTSQHTREQLQEPSQPIDENRELRRTSRHSRRDPREQSPRSSREQTPIEAQSPRRASRNPPLFHQDSISSQLSNQLALSQPQPSQNISPSSDLNQNLSPES